MRVDEQTAEACPIEEFQTLATVNWHRRHVDSLAVRLAFALLSIGVVVLCVVMELSVADAAGFIAAVMLIGWILSRLEPSQSSRRRLGCFPRNICLTGNILRVAMPRGNEHFSLNESCWFLGKSTDDPLLSVGQKAQNAVIVVSPMGLRLACGIDRGSTQAWAEAIERVGCRRVIRRAGAVGIVLSIIIFVLLLAGGVLGYCLASLLAGALSPTDRVMTDVALASGITFGGFASFMCVWMLLPSWYRPIAVERHTLYRFAAFLPSAVVLSSYRVLSLPLLVAIGFALAAASVLLLLTVWFTIKN